MSTRCSPGRRYTRALRRAVISAKGWTQLDQIWHAGGREGGREGREGRGGEGRGGRGGEGGQGRGGDCPHFPQTRTFVTAEPSRTPASRVTG